MWKVILFVASCFSLSAASITVPVGGSGTWNGASGLGQPNAFGFISGMSDDGHTFSAGSGSLSVAPSGLFFPQIDTFCTLDGINSVTCLGSLSSGNTGAFIFFPKGGGAQMTVGVTGYYSFGTDVCGNPQILSTCSGHWAVVPTPEPSASLLTAAGLLLMVGLVANSKRPRLPRAFGLRES